MECSPPAVGLSYQFSADASVENKAEFEAFLVTFGQAYGNILAELQRADVVLAAGENLVVAAQDAVKGAVQTQLDGNVDAKATVGLGCALTELDSVATVIEESGSRLSGSMTAATALTGEFAG